MSFRALLFVQENCAPCHRTLTALNNAFDKSDYITVTPYRGQDGTKTEIAEKYGVDVTPTLIVVRPSGSVLGTFKGSTKMPAAFFSKLARYLNTANESDD